MHDEVDPNEPKLPFVSWVGLLVATAMVAVSLTGLAGRLNRLTVGAALVAAFATAVATRSRFDLRLASKSPVLLLVVLAVLPAVLAFSPPCSWDEVAYGAALPRDYARAGRFFYNADYGVISAFPANFEALTTASIVLFHSVVPAQLLTTGLALGLAVIAFQLCRRLGLGLAPSLLSGAMVLLAPALVAIDSVVKNDTANAFFQVLFLLMLVEYGERPRAGTAVLAGLFLGTAIGVKYSALQFAFVAMPVAALAMLGRQRPSAERVRHVALLGLTTFLVGLPWYARSALLLGNPLFPFYNDVFGAKNGFTPLHTTIFTELSNVQRAFNWSTGTVADFVTTVFTELGALPVVLALPGLAIGILGTKRERLWPLAAVFVAYTLLTLRAGFWLPRYFLSLLVLASILAVLCVDAAASAVRRYRGGRVVLWSLLGIVFCATSGRLADELLYQCDAVQDLFTLDRSAFAAKRCRYWRVARWLNHHTRESDRIGIGMNVQPFYYLERSYFHIHPTSDKGNLQAAHSPEDFLRAFRDLHLTVLAVRKWNCYQDMGDMALPGRAPHADAFLADFYSAVRVLYARGQLKHAQMVEDVHVFWIEPRSEAALASR